MSGELQRILIIGVLIANTVSEDISYSFCKEASFTGDPTNPNGTYLTSIRLQTDQYPDNSKDHNCRCVITAQAEVNALSISSLLTLWDDETMEDESEGGDDGGMMSDDDDECSPFMQVSSSNRTGYYLCGGLRESVGVHKGYKIMMINDQVTFHLHNPRERFIKGVVDIHAVDGSFTLECRPYDQEWTLDFCPCFDMGETFSPALAIKYDVPVRQRLLAGFLAAIIFLLIFGGIMAAHWFYKKRKLKEKHGLEEPHVASREAAAVANPAYDADSEKGGSFLYDEVDPVTGRTRIRIDPDPTLNLTPQTGSVFGDTTQNNGSRDSGLYSMVKGGMPSATPEISPYASSASVLTEPQPHLAGFGIEPPSLSGFSSSPGYAPSYSPAPYAMAKDLNYPVPIRQSYTTDPQQQLSAAELENLYAKPMKKPKGKSKQDEGGDLDMVVPPVSNGFEDIDFQLPVPRARLNTSKSSIETDV